VQHVLLLKIGADDEDRTRDLTLAKLCVTISTTPAISYAARRPLNRSAA